MHDGRRTRDAVIRVLLADDQPLLRGGIRALLDGEADIEVVAETANGAHALQMTREYLPDIVLTEMPLPGIDGVEVTERIVADPDLAHVRVVVLTSCGIDTRIFDALRAGAAGYLVKGISLDELLHALRVIARGDALLAPAVTRTVISRLVTQPPPMTDEARLQDLTKREREAVSLVARGLSTSQIADRMVISPLTAKTHLDRARSKLHVRDRSQLVVVAYESGLVAPRRG